MNRGRKHYREKEKEQKISDHVLLLKNVNSKTN